MTEHDYRELALSMAAIRERAIELSESPGLDQATAHRLLQLALLAGEIVLSTEERIADLEART